MNNDTAVALASLNNAFYGAYADSFASTRRSAWPGWIRCAQQLRACWGEDDPRLSGEVPLRVLDVARCVSSDTLRRRFPRQICV